MSKMGKNSSATSASGNTPSATITGTATNRSSILRSSFAPTAFQLQLFASVIQSFDTNQLRLHDISSGRLRQQHATTAGVEITSLDWGHYGFSFNGDKPSSKKKRKRTQNASENAVVAYGTTSSEICMYSPAEGRVVAKLPKVHEKGIRDFKFRSDDDTEAWSIGGDGKLVQWNLLNSTAVRTISLPDSSIRLLSRPSALQPQVICASSKPFSIDTSIDDAQIDSYDALKNPIHSLIRSGRSRETENEAFIAADADRYLNVFAMETKQLTRTLIAGSEVQHVDLFSPQDSNDDLGAQLLAVVTKDGVVELFPQPFNQTSPVNGDLKSKRKNMTRRAHAQVKLVQTGLRESVPIYTASLQGSEIVIVSVDGGVEPIFQKVRWQDEGTGDLLFEGVKEVQRIKKTSALRSAQMNGVKDMSKNHLDDSKTVIVNGHAEAEITSNAIEISSDEEADDTEGESEAGEEILQEDGDQSDGVAEENGALVEHEGSASDSDEEMVDAEVNNEEPSFGDMLASKHPETISISSALINHPDADHSTTRQLAVPAGMSLGTVLTQALKSNDNNLLESCLHANDNGIIQNTIQRLDSALAAILLSKLAERLASRPGRYGHLLAWVQWTCIAHGGAIAGQPDVNAKLKTLYQVLNQRSSSLDQLLLLKGKLDMLEAQLEFRKQIQAQRGSNSQNNNEPGMIYIEGDDDNWSSDGDHDEAPGVPQKLGFKTKVPLKKDLSGLVSDDSSSEEDDDNMPTTNGVVPGDSDEEEESDSEIDASGRRRQGVLDVEAEVQGEDEQSNSEVTDDMFAESEEEEERGEEEDEEDDSSMADFINDGEISEVSDEGDIDLDDDEDNDNVARKPATKRSKHR